MSAAMAGSRRNRWALSFADLMLLLVGYFVLLQASGGQRNDMIASVGQQFGAQAPSPAIDRRNRATRFADIRAHGHRDHRIDAIQIFEARLRKSRTGGDQGREEEKGADHGTGSRTCSAFHDRHEASSVPIPPFLAHCMLMRMICPLPSPLSA